MWKKRKHVEANTPTPETSDGEVVERPKRSLLGWKDKDNKPEEEGRETKFSNGGGVFRNKEKILVTCSRRINFRYRHLMLNLVSMLPHCTKDNKVDSKAGKGTALNALVELRGCSSCLFFECRKNKDLYLWMARCPNGPSVKFLVNAVHTMEELNLTGNSLKGCRPLMTFSGDFEKESHWKLLKEMILQITGPYNESSIVNGGSLDKMTLIEIGPRFCLNPIRIFGGSFGGPTLYENPYYVSPNQIRALEKKQKAVKYVKKVKAKTRRKMEELSNTIERDEFADMWEE